MFTKNLKFPTIIQKHNIKMTTDRLEDWRKTMRIIVDCKNGIYPQDIHEDRIPKYNCKEERGVISTKNTNPSGMSLPQAGQTMQAGVSNSVVFGKHVKRNVHSDLTTLVPIGPSKKSLAKLDPSSFDNSRLKNHSITSQKNIVQSKKQ